MYCVKCGTELPETAGYCVQCGAATGKATQSVPPVPLVRSATDKKIAGVCGGIANTLGWDPTLVRVVYVLASVLSAAFPGILVYILLWVIMPEEGEVMHYR